MHIYKEIYFGGNKCGFDNIRSLMKTFSTNNWLYVEHRSLKNYILFDYNGNECESAEVSIYLDEDSWSKGRIRVTNIVPLDKTVLTVDEYNAVLDCFYHDIIFPNIDKFQQINITVDGPTSEQFNPLNYITDEALKKLEDFCNAANKSTGSSHPDDEARWFEFIIQTVEDERVFDYDTLFNFLIDDEYWEKKDEGFIGTIGNYAWSEEQAEKLSMEYDNYVRILRYYKKREL